MANEVIERELREDKLVDEEEDDEQIEEAWDDWQSDEEESSPDCLCLFCSSKFDSADAVFHHCHSLHCFDFRRIVRDLGLDFYGSFKLINYVRSQVADNKCWCCDLTFTSSRDLQDHLHAASSFKKDGIFFWENDLYLKPFRADDPLLHSFAGDEDEEDDFATLDKAEIIKELMDDKQLTKLQSILTNDKSDIDAFDETKIMESCVGSMDLLRTTANGNGIRSCQLKQTDKQIRISLENAAAGKIKKVNESYFGAYGSFAIHREMISDKVRMDAYRGALLNNPSLVKQATVLDVGCGTGILSLFAAQAGASKVIAVEASKKMAAVATQIARDNGFLSEDQQKGEEKLCSRVMNVVECMVEELDKFIEIQPNSVDILVSEWMGYCLLYESMLSSVLYARDRWLKLGGAILPDTATIFGAGFGRGGTNLPFWENVYGFNMSCIGKEVVEDAACVPIVDVIDSRDIVTDSAVVHSFDLAKMKQDEMDFTASFELKLRKDLPGNAASTASGICLCYGIVLWFETGFTSRFCKEVSTVLSTSPHSPKTHWYQTIFTFREPVAMTSSETIATSTAAIGTDECPAVRIVSRVSIVRSSEFRSIDISMEISGYSVDGQKRSWPVQIFNL